jgi:hypothetical protein
LLRNARARFLVSGMSVFSQPEYIHVLLNPIPVYGLAMGVLALLLAMALRSRPGRVVALAIVFLSSASAWPVFFFGEKAYDNVMMLTNEAGTDWMEEHQGRAEKTIVAFYLLAGVSLAAIFLPPRYPGADLPLSVVTLILGVLVLAIGTWISYAGGRIRHEEFRTGPAPEVQKAK